LVELTIRELAATAAEAVAAAEVRGANRRVTELPDERTIRWYSTIGLLDRPVSYRGRTALYGERHVLQLVAIKRRQAEGRALAEIQDELVGATDRTLRSIAAVPVPPRGAAAPRAVALAASATAPAAPGETSERRFWREHPTAAPTPELLTGLELGGGVVLLLHVQPGAEDIDSIRAAARPLLDLLARRRLTRGSTS
jgi:DNA-binding transcriptional MerR regulator